MTDTERLDRAIELLPQLAKLNAPEKVLFEMGVWIRDLHDTVCENEEE